MSEITAKPARLFRRMSRVIGEKIKVLFLVLNPTRKVYRNERNSNFKPRQKALYQYGQFIICRIYDPHKRRKNGRLSFNELFCASEIFD